MLRSLQPTQTACSTLFYFALIVVLPATSARSQPPPVWKSGAAFQLRMTEPVSITWAENPLRNALRNLGRSQSVAVMLDRRVDPDQKVELQVNDMPLEQVFGRLASRLQIGVCTIDSVVYVGPPEITGRLDALAAAKRDEVRTMPEPARRRWLQRRAWQWETLTTPKTLLEEIAAEAAMPIRGAEKVPHDLWPAGSLPPLTLADRLTLTLAGFNVTYRVVDDGAALQLIPIPEHLVLQRSYATGSLTRAWAEQLAEHFPEASIEQAGTRLQIVASAEDHQRIARLIAGRTASRPRPSPVDRSLQRYTVTQQNRPFEPIIRDLARQLGLRLTLDPSLTEQQLGKRISFKVTEAKLDELLRAVVQAAGLNYKRQGDDLTVLPQ